MSESLITATADAPASADENTAQDVANAQALPLGPVQESSSTAEPDSPSAELQAWFLNENVAGVGDKPDWLSSKFKTVSDQAKAYKEAERKLGGFVGAPETYDLTSLTNNEEMNVDTESPMFKNFQTLAQESGMSQEVFDKVVGTYLEGQVNSISTPEAELEKLGPNAQEKIGTISNWINNNFSPEDSTALKALATSAENVMLLDRIRNLTKEAGLPSAQQASEYQEKLNEKYLEQLVQDPRYMTDEVFRAEVGKKFNTHYS